MFILLCLLVLVVSVNAQHDTDMRYHQHRQSLPQQQHQPILSGSLFPETKTAESKMTHTACPSVCKDHGSGHYFAVTSLGEGFPRVQYTCSHLGHPQPTYPPGKDKNSGQHFQGNPSNHVQNPAEPIPEHTPSSIHHLICDVNGCHSTLLSDHIAASSPLVHEHGYRSHYGIVFSPREQFTAEEIHTTTLTYSKNEHLHARPIHTSDPAEARSHEQELHSGRFKTTPEPIFPGPTSGSNKANVHPVSPSVQESLSGEEQRVGPPQPTPEPTPGQVNTAPAGSEPQGVLHASDSLTVRHYNHETKQGQGMKTIVHRVTTIIMETETFIARPLPTPRNEAHHPNKK
ncbi:hypothetical protein BGZ92_005279, partial [Podila epicladia]